MQIKTVFADCVMNPLSTGKVGIHFECPCAPDHICKPTGGDALDTAPAGNCSLVTFALLGAHLTFKSIFHKDFK